MIPRLRSLPPFPELSTMHGATWTCTGGTLGQLSARLKHWWVLMVDKALKIPILDGLHPHLASSYIILHPHSRLMVPACCWHQLFVLSVSIKHGLLLDRHVYRFTPLVASCHVGSPIWISILDLWDVHPTGPKLWWCYSPYVCESSPS
jgi:hypothetical protein